MHASEGRGDPRNKRQQQSSKSTAHIQVKQPKSCSLFVSESLQKVPASGRVRQSAKRETSASS